MTKLRSVTLLFTLSAFVAAADLTGRWKGEIVNADGSRRQWEFLLKSEGGKLTGVVGTPNDDFPISDGFVDGDEITITHPRNPGTPSQTLRGRLVGAELHFPMGGPRGSKQILVVRRVSTSPAPAPLPPVSLPALHTLPANGLAQTPPMGWSSWMEQIPHFRHHR